MGWTGEIPPVVRQLPEALLSFETIVSSANMGRRDSNVHTQLISQALQRFHAELGDNDVALADIQSPEELLSQARELEPLRAGEDQKSGSRFRLESILSHINDFAAIAALSNGSGAQLTGTVWASLKIILSLVSRSQDTLDRVLSMLDDISLALPRFRTYAETLTMTPGLEAAMVDAYTEMLCFCARAIKFFRTAPHHFLIRAGWPRFDGDCQRTIRRLKDLSQIVDREAEAVRLQADQKRNIELGEALDMLKISDRKSLSIPCHTLPRTSIKAFFGRRELLDTIEKEFNEAENSRIKCVLLYGLGGVGKSSVAIEYAASHLNSYDAVVWIPADSKIKAQHGFHAFASRIGLISDGDDTSETSTAIMRAKTWLQNTECRWLMIFDNIEEPELLDSILPESHKGHVLLTSRDKSIAFGNRMTAYRVEPFGTEVGVSALLTLVGKSNSSEQEKASATKIVRVLGGLPLALNHISGFITQQDLSLVDFLPLYEKNAAKIDNRSLKRSGDEHTLGTVWAVAFDRMPQDANSLLNLLALLDPDSIREEILMDTTVNLNLNADSFGFLESDMDFIDAKEPILANSLIERDGTTKILSMHRLVQAAAIRRLSDSEKTKLLDAAVTLLGHGFPNTWNKVTSHQFTAWTQCELRIAHVKALSTKAQTYKIRTENPKAFAELYFRFAWYLYERELYEHAEQFLRQGLDILEETDTIMFASAFMLKGLVELDTKRLVSARGSFLNSLQIREKFLDPNDELIASSLNALSLVFTELNQLEDASIYGNRAIEIRLRTQSDRIGNSYSNMSSTLLRMGKPDEAEEMLGRCPSLKDFSDSTFLAGGNPRFAGDMILLSRIRWKQGETEAALRLASKALAFRQRTHGKRLKTCDCLQLVADLLCDSDDTSAAIYYLKESASIAEELPDGKGYLARANQRLASVCAKLGEDRDHQVYLEAAYKTLREVAGSDDVPNDDNMAEEDRFNSLVPWMLW